MMKNYCVSCLRKYKQTEERYIHTGNFCSGCVKIINENVTDKDKREESEKVFRKVMQGLINGDTETT